MPISYHRFAGSSLERLSALSDGVFAVAMTLLVLDLKVPSIGGGPRATYGTRFFTRSPRVCCRTP